MTNEKLLRFKAEAKRGEPHKTIAFKMPTRILENILRDYPNLSTGRTARALFEDQFKKYLTA